MEKTHPYLEIPPNLNCMCTFEDITLENSNYCEYRTYPSGNWSVSNYSSDIILHLIKTQFESYLDKVEKASKDCAAAVRRLVLRGPPIYLEDVTALPIPENDTHIDKIWVQNLNLEISSVLENALEGEEREALWNSQKETLKAMEDSEKS